MVKSLVMKKYIPAIFIAGFIWFIFVFDRPYFKFTNEGLTTKDHQFIETLIEKEEGSGVVENEKLLALLRKDLKGLIDKLNLRNKECLKNAEEFFNRSKQEIYGEKNILNNIDFVFKNTLRRVIAGKLYNKIDDLIEAGVIMSPKRVRGIGKNIEICRPKKSLKFIDIVIGKIKDFNSVNKKKVTNDLVKKINDIMIGTLDSFMNVRLAVRYLAKMEKLKLIIGGFEKSNYQLEVIEKKCFYAVDNAKNNDRLVKIFSGCRSKLTKYTIKLKDKLKSFKI